jgi:hypothetical protein
VLEAGMRELEEALRVEGNARRWSKTAADGEEHPIRKNQCSIVDVQDNFEKLSMQGTFCKM